MKAMGGRTRGQVMLAVIASTLDILDSNNMIKIRCVVVVSFAKSEYYQLKHSLRL